MDGQVLIAASCIVAFLSYRYKARGGRPRKGSPASGFVANMGDQSPMPPFSGPEIWPAWQEVNSLHGIGLFVSALDCQCQGGKQQHRRAAQTEQNQQPRLQPADGRAAIGSFWGRGGRGRCCRRCAFRIR